RFSRDWSSDVCSSDLDEIHDRIREFVDIGQDPADLLPDLLRPCLEFLPRTDARLKPVGDRRYGVREPGGEGIPDLTRDGGELPPLVGRAVLRPFEVPDGDPGLLGD